MKSVATAELVTARASMHPCVAFGTQCDQVLFHVATRLAAELEVMNLQVLHVPAELASPAIAFQYPTMQLTVCVRVEPESWVLVSDLLHEALRTTSGGNNEMAKAQPRFIQGTPDQDHDCVEYVDDKYRFHDKAPIQIA